MCEFKAGGYTGQPAQRRKPARSPNSPTLIGPKGTWEKIQPAHRTSPCKPAPWKPGQFSKTANYSPTSKNLPTQRPLRIVIILYIIWNIIISIVSNISIHIHSEKFYSFRFLFLDLDFYDWGFSRFFLPSIWFVFLLFRLFWIFILFVFLFLWRSCQVPFLIFF